MKHASKKQKPRRTEKTRMRRGAPHGSTRRRKQPINRKITEVLARMRKEGISLRVASRGAKVSPKTVLKTASSALRKNQSGRYKAKSSDRLVRTLMIPTPKGPQEINVRGLRAASLLGRYWIAVHKYYENGDKSVQKFSGEFITATDGVKYPLLTDLDVLNRLGSAGVLTFESLYGRSA